MSFDALLATLWLKTQEINQDEEEGSLSGAGKDRNCAPTALHPPKWGCMCVHADSGTVKSSFSDF